MRRLLAGLMLVLLAGGASVPATGADTSLEYAVKAAYLPKFVPFIHWPDNAFAAPAAPLTICVLGVDPFGPRLEQAVRATQTERPMEVRRVSELDGESRCQMIFLPAGTDPALVRATLEAMRGRPVVTATDSGMAAHGIISFTLQANHVRFDIDDALAAEGGLAISSKLLGLARNVKQRGQP